MCRGNLKTPLLIAPCDMSETSTVQHHTCVRVGPTFVQCGAGWTGCPLNHLITRLQVVTPTCINKAQGADKRVPHVADALAQSCVLRCAKQPPLELVPA